MDNVTALSANERIKASSNFLRGTIEDGLTRVETGALADDDTQLTKFHGFYQQDDRDLRAERGKQRMEKAFSFMVRMRVPAGILTPMQWLGVEKLALERANGTIRLTTRETIQFHGILKGNLRPLMQGLHDDMLDTIAACGDVNRNVIATADPWRRELHASVSELARDISVHLLPKTRAWHEIWLDEEKIAGGVEEDEPILRAHLSAAQVQDRGGAAAAQRCGRVRARPWVHRDCRGWAGCRLQRGGWRRHGDDPR